LALRRADVCAGCSACLAPGTRAAWDATSRTVSCLSCADALAATLSAPHQIDQPALGGASAQREYERRSQRREQQVRSRHPKLAGLVLALSKEPVSTRVWAQGARGERAVAAKLDELAGEHVAVLHDRAIRRLDGRLTRANIDHIAIAASGVWVIDAKTHHGALEVRRSGGLFNPRVERLFIGGRDRTSLLEGLAGQVAAVAAELVTVNATVPVHGALCFVGTELPWFGASIGGIPLVGRRGMAKLLKVAGALEAEDRLALAQFLATRFPVAG
jgi:hypothetical protein